MTNQLLKINYHLDKLIYEYYDKEDRQDEIKKGKLFNLIYLNRNRKICNIEIQNCPWPKVYILCSDRWANWSSRRRWDNFLICDSKY